MSTKALRTQLIAAVAMVMVAAIALGSSTFAWFAENNKVTAEGMTMTAQTAATLAISEDGTNYGTSMGLATAAANLNPVTLVDYSSSTTKPTQAHGTTVTATSTKSGTIAGTVAFYNLTDANEVTDPSIFNAKKLMSESITADNVSTYFAKNTTDYVTDDIWVKYVGADASATVKLTFELVDNSATAALPINNAFHVAFVDVETGNIWNYDVSGATGTAIDTNEDGNNDAYSYKTEIASFVTLASDTPVHYQVYVWVEGEDTHCTTNNAVASNQLTMNIAFEK